MSYMDKAAQAGGLKNLLESADDGAEKELERMFHSPLFELIGLKVEKARDGNCELSVGLKKESTRLGDMMHGGITMFVLDNAASMAVMTANSGISQATLELKVNFLSPASKEPFRAHGNVLKMGRSTAVAEGRLLDAQGKVCAVALGTWFLVQESPKKNN
jgi:uncharacterized protein (TIGR00369 family)